jgi:hypothetical protein
MYINLSSVIKLNRALVINSTIGANGLLQVYSGSPPPSPDYPATGTLLASLPLATSAATAFYCVQQAIINNPGVNGTDGTSLVSGTTGSGVMCQISVQILNGAIFAVQAISLPGAYVTSPTDITNEPVIGAGLAGATLSLVMTGQLNFTSIPQSIILTSGTAGYARLTDNTGIIGMMDLDINVIQPSGSPNPSVIINTMNLVQGGPISVLTNILFEQ